MTAAGDSRTFLCLNVPPSTMDELWAEGWRHFGIFFFQYRTSLHDGEPCGVMPLRVDLERFVLSRSQKRVLKNNRDTKVAIRPSFIDEEKETLFRAHRLRFKENIPSSLYDFLSPLPDRVPCPNLELCVYLDEKLVGVTFLDLGEAATSGVYAIFDPALAERSLGILMMLHSIRFSRERELRYYYPGYAYSKPSSYDYKKRLTGLQYLDWHSGWTPFHHRPGSR